MKLQSVSVIFLLGVMGLVEMANGLCLVRNTTDPDRYWYQCFRSIDYLADMKRAPVDIHEHTVSNSKIRVVRNGSYARMAKSLKRVVVIYCGVEEIEDNAFQGLTELKVLAFPGNKLDIIKSSWFVGLSSLKVVSFQDNRIKHVEDKFFVTLPPLDTLDISNNELTCLPTASFGNFKVKEIYFRHNRLTWKCKLLVSNWLENANIWGDYRWQYEPNDVNMDPPYIFAKICGTELPKSQLNEENLNRCAEEKVHQLLPFKGDYTVEQVCEFLKSEPSLFLNCTK